MNLAQAILLIPPGFYLRCGCERDEDTQKVFGSAAIYEEPPEDGWPNPRHPADRHRDSIIVSISSDETDFEAFELLLVNMIVERYGSKRQQDEAMAKLDKMADRREKKRLAASGASAVKERW